MRRFLLAALMLGAASGAQAADMPDFLRGSFPAVQTSQTRNWSGWYAGGQVGYSSAHVDQSQSLTGITNFIYRNSVLEDPTSQLTTLANTNAQGPSFGAFVGRNYQWDDVVLGVEANYNYLQNMQTSAAASIGPLSNSFPTAPSVTTVYSYKISGTSAVQIKDAVTFRGRAGWATGDFLPYMFGGLAVGRMDVQRNVKTNTVGQDFTSTTDAFGVTTVTAGNPYQITQATTPAAGNTQGRSNNFVAGWTGGLGFEYALWDGIFLRGEWEYIKFMSVMNTSVSLNSAHFGVGYKF
jgi:outer membrane immunogenic protein